MTFSVSTSLKIIRSAADLRDAKRRLDHFSGREDFLTSSSAAPIQSAPGDCRSGRQNRPDELVKEMAARLGQVSDRGAAQGGLLDGERKPEMGSGVYPHRKN